MSAIPGLFTWKNEQHVLLKEFKGFSLGLTDKLKESVESVAAATGQTIQHLASSSLSKEALVEELLRRELDVFLTDKDAVAKEIEDSVRRRAGELGLEIASVGIQDLILSGDMKDLMKKVTDMNRSDD